MLVLASKSPRRKEILQKLGLEFECMNAECDENLPHDIKPEDAVMLLAHRKAEAIFKKRSHDTVIGSDTIVVHKGVILTKPSDEDDAFKILKCLSGQTHSVYTGVSILSEDKTSEFFSKTEVTFAPISDEEIEWYISTREPFDKAGAYGIQGYGCRFIEKINGDYYTVVWLPAQRVAKELANFGY